MRRGVLVAWLLLCVPGLALADADERFARLRDEAEALGSLGMFLDSYIGECTGVLAGPGCRGNAEAFRQRYAGKKLYMIIVEDVVTMVSMGTFAPATGEYTLRINPVFPGATYFVTEGTPKQLDGSGNPLVTWMTVSGMLREGWNAQMLSNLFAKKKVRLQAVFTPMDVWAMQGPGRKVYGVSAKMEAILLTSAKDGETLGLWLADGNKSRKKKKKGK